MKSKYIFLPLVIAVVLVFVYINRQSLIASIFNTRAVTSNLPKTTNPSAPDNKSKSEPAVFATDLNTPWEIVFLPTGEMLVTERAGRLLKIGPDTKVITVIEGVRHQGEGGLLGMALHPNFKNNNFIYLYYTTTVNNQITNTLERHVLKNDTLTDKKVLLGNIKGSNNHDGGRIAFGPDGYLYIATGDAEDPSLSQDKTSLNGKILRIDGDGNIPTDNPFGNEVYSLGHRNPQGLAWDDHSNLWVNEHGPSGLQTGNDEINLITKGGNYGWPTIKGTQTAPGLLTPVLESGKEDTWAPAGMAFYGDSLYFSGLRGSALYKAKIKGNNQLELTTHFKQQFGRVRAVVLGPDNFLYITTSNTDGRGKPKADDDKIIKIDPKTL